MVSTMDEDISERRADTAQHSRNAKASKNDENNQRTFVAMVTLEVLEKTGAVKSFREFKWVKHTRRLVNKTVEGLPLGKVLDMSPKEVALNVVAELQEKFGRKKLKVMLLLEDPGVEAMITECFQSQIMAFSGVPRYGACQCTGRTLRICFFVVATVMSAGAALATVITLLLMVF